MTEAARVTLDDIPVLSLAEHGEPQTAAPAGEGDDAEALGADRSVIPGGAYLRARLQGEPEEICPRIAGTFHDLLRQATPDASRSWLEFYRRHDQVDVLLPAAQ